MSDVLVLFDAPDAEPRRAFRLCTIATVSLRVLSITADCSALT